MTLEVTLKHEEYVYLLQDSEGICIIQKQTVTHIKAPILSFLEPEERGSGIITPHVKQG